MPVVQLFHTCLVNEFAPHVGLAVVRVLEHLGFEVDVPPDQTCCGQPAFNAGFHEQARVAARHTIATLEATTGPIIIPSGSCGDMVTHQFGVLFDHDEPWQARARAVAERCHEFSAFVDGHSQGASLGALQTSVAYHPSCHLSRGLGIDREPRAILAAVSGIKQVAFTADDECCGFGGLFAVKHSEISSRMLNRKLDAVTSARPERLVTCDMGCLLHLAGGLHRRASTIKVQHLAEIVDEALR
jgi:L-lactate dehydrogenase complex protein LldE